MDMITKIELEDAVKNYNKVGARIIEVALIVGNIKGELSVYGRPNIKNSDWRVENWRVDFKEPTANMAHLKDISCTVDFVCDFNNRPETIEFADAGYKDYDDYDRVVHYTRRVQFPYEYLFTEGWEAECEARHKAIEERLKGWKAEQLEKSIAEVEKHLLKLQSDLKELKNA